MFLMIMEKVICKAKRTNNSRVLKAKILILESWLFRCVNKNLESFMLKQSTGNTEFKLHVNVHQNQSKS